MLAGPRFARVHFFLGRGPGPDEDRNMASMASRWTTTWRASLALLVCVAFLLRPVQAALHGLSHSHTGGEVSIIMLPGGGHVHAGGHGHHGHAGGHGHHGGHGVQDGQVDLGIPGHSHPAYDRGEPSLGPASVVHCVTPGPLAQANRPRIGPAGEIGRLDDAIARAGPPPAPERGLSDCRAPPAGRS